MHGMQEVGGSIPPGSTSLRRLRLLRLGKPHRSEGCRVVARRAKTGLGKSGSDIIVFAAKASPSLPRYSLHSEYGPRQPMKYVYILESQDLEHFYVGITDDVPARLVKHNAGEVAHTSKYRPWKLKTYVAFSDEKQAFAFENI